jgi:hypothetical protein
MADTAIFSPSWSFVALGDFPYDLTVCHEPETVCIPMISISDLRFQVYASVLSPTPVVAFPERTIFAYPIPLDADCQYDEIPDFPDLKPLEATVTPISDKVGAVAVISFDTQNITSFDDIPVYGSGGTISVGDCFKFVIVEVWTSGVSKEVVSQTTLGCTNCFKRVSDPCFLSRIEYSNNENAFDFYYNNGNSLGNPNRVLLPFYLHSPQLLHDESSYQTSSGVYIKLSERIEEELILQTDYMPQGFHRRLKIALAHDFINISNTNYDDLINISNDFVCRDPYEIDWKPDIVDLQLAQGKTKVKISAPLSLYNSNCKPA